MPRKLEEYERKRDFERTPEPGSAPGDGGDGRRFVIQEHHAGAAADGFAGSGQAGRAAADDEAGRALVFQHALNIAPSTARGKGS